MHYFAILLKIIITIVKIFVKNYAYEVEVPIENKLYS